MTRSQKRTFAGFWVPELPCLSLCEA